MIRAGSAGIGLLVLALVTGGCSSSTTKTNLSSSSSAAPAPRSTSASESLTQAHAQKALLTPAQVGATFTRVLYTPQDQKAPCASTGPALEDVVPQTRRVGTTIVSLTLQASFSEELFAYTDDRRAAQAFAFLTSGVKCKSGRLPLNNGGSLAVTFGSVRNVTGQLKPALKAVAVQVDSASTKGILAAAQLGRLMLVFTFAAFKSTPDTVLPNPIGLVARAVTKVAKS